MILGMTVTRFVLTIVHVLVCLFLIAVVLLQKGKTAGLSGSIAGAADTFFGKNKARDIDSILSRSTTIAAIIFLITSVVLAVMVIKIG